MLTPDFNNLVIHSDASITDMVAFHGLLRDIECSQAGILYPAIHTYKEVQLGGGAIFPAVSFINGWSLQFPEGNWYISGGNLAAIINPVANCYVMQTQSAAFAVSSALGGSTGPTAEDIWNHAVEGQYTATEILRLMAAVLAGKVSGADTSTIKFRDLEDTKDRIIAETDSAGNRTSVIKDVS
jgi:hypothetical protein